MADEAPTKSQRLMVTLLKTMTLEEVVPVLQYSLCDYHKRLLAVTLIFPDDRHECEEDHHTHSENEEDRLADMLMKADTAGSMQ